MTFMCKAEDDEINKWIELKNISLGEEYQYYLDEHEQYGRCKSSTLQFSFDNGETWHSPDEIAKALKEPIKNHSPESAEIWRNANCRAELKSKSKALKEK